MKKTLVPNLACPRCREPLTCDVDLEEVVTGNLHCHSCGAGFPIVRGIPVLLDDPGLSGSDTSELYSDIWNESSHGRYRAREGQGGYRAPARSHLELLEQASGESLVQGAIGIDAGCGTGSSTIEMARRYPQTDIVGIDLSSGPQAYADAAMELPNAHFVRGNLLETPFAKSSYDFVFSFGVLHHTPDPEAAFHRLLDCLRPGGRFTIFLYKDFSDIPVKRFFLGFVTWLRRFTTRIPSDRLGQLSRLFAPFVFALLTLPSRALASLGATSLARHIPYGTFPGVSAVASSLQDRFGAPYEFRFSARTLEGWAARAGMEQSKVVDCLAYGFSGLVLSGRKALAGQSPEPRKRSSSSANSTLNVVSEP